MSITIPSVRNYRGATTADVIAEQIALCRANLESIERIAYYRKPREKRDEINRRLRGCNDFLGMAGSRKWGCLYREKGLGADEDVVCEHAIPVTSLVSLYEAGIPFEDIVFYPIARISKESDRRFNRLGLVKSGHELSLPFLRYHKADIKIETHEGVAISCELWTMDDHWKLLRETKELHNVQQEVLQKLSVLLYKNL